jgi:hypothetical protein
MLYKLNDRKRDISLDKADLSTSPKAKESWHSKGCHFGYFWLL